jgi:hypothetical protein
MKYTGGRQNDFEAHGYKVAGGSTVLISGTYFASAGQHMAAVQVRGRWANLHMLANRLEDIPDNPAAGAHGPGLY